jgi:hypothetical protein
LLLVVFVLAMACGGPTSLAPAAPHAATWPVPWIGSFCTGNTVAPDGRYALVTTCTGPRDFGPVLYRLEPPGPVASLNEVFGARVQVGMFSNDGKRLAVLINRRPEGEWSLDYDCGVLDLETRASRRFRVSKSADGVPAYGGATWFAGSEFLAGFSEQRLKRFRADTGAELPLVELPEPESIESISPAAPLLVSLYERRRRVFRIEGDAAHEVGKPLECSSWSGLRWSEHAAMFALRCDDDLVVWRPERVLRVPLSEPNRRSTLAFGNQGRAVALGGDAEPIAFDTASGKSMPFASFVADTPGFAVTGSAQRLWRDDKQRPARVPLPGMPELLEVRAADWKAERRVTLTVATDNRDLRKLELELETARVKKSERVEALPASPESDDMTAALRPEEEDELEADENGDIVAEITAKGRVVARGPLVAEERGHVAIRRPDGTVELWTDDGRRVGKLPQDTRRIPYLSPSGALGIEPRGNGAARLVRTSTGEALTLLLVRRGERTLGLVTGPSGWFTGDAEAYSWLRFARGHDAFDAMPLTGRDVKREWERPKALRDFLAGRPLAQERRPEVPSLGR